MTKRSLLTLLLFAQACTDASETGDESFATASTFAEGSKEARAIVELVNAPSTDAASLKSAGVTSTTTVKAVLARRTGPDGLDGTDDDAPFESLGAFDDVKGIGPATLKKLAAFALARGYGNERGIYHGVYFTENQADRTLELANTVSVATLDTETSVDSRALKNIENARPIVSMDELASLSRVKGMALRLLREHADRELGPTPCDAENECATGLSCLGATELAPGRCVESISGGGDLCSAEGVCGPGLICAGRSDGFEGICNPSWTRDEFVSESSGSLPDGPDGAVGESVQVMGLATVPTDAIVRVMIDHPRPDDLELTLTNPFETTVMVWPRGSGAIPTAPEGIIAMVPGDEVANGLWTLTITDTESGEQGMISLFTLELTTRFD